jgi:hypothetical protein
VHPGREAQMAADAQVDTRFGESAISRRVWRGAADPRRLSRSRDVMQWGVERRSKAVKNLWTASRHLAPQAMIVLASCEGQHRLYELPMQQDAASDTRALLTPSSAGSSEGSGGGSASETPDVMTVPASEGPGNPPLDTTSSLGRTEYRVAPGVRCRAQFGFGQSRRGSDPFARGRPGHHLHRFSDRRRQIRRLKRECPVAGAQAEPSDCCLSWADTASLATPADSSSERSGRGRRSRRRTC